LSLTGLRVVEIRCGTGVLGAGMASALPGMVFAQLGADVSVITVGGAYDDSFDHAARSYLVWDRRKRLLRAQSGSPELRTALATELAVADLVVAVGTPARLEAEGADVGAVRKRNPGAVWIGVEDSGDGLEPRDHELIVQADTGLMTIGGGARPGPVFSAIPLAGYGAALTVLTAAFAALVRSVGAPGSTPPIRTSMREGLAATLVMKVIDDGKPGFLTLPSPSRHWLFRAGDGRWVHLNLVLRAAQAGLSTVLKQWGFREAAALSARAGEFDPAVREAFATRPSAEWMAALAQHGVPAQVALTPAEALNDPDFAADGMIEPGPLPGGGTAPMVTRFFAESRPQGRSVLGALPSARPPEPVLPLTGVNVLDFGAYIAGPYGTEVLRHLGARVIKVEPVTGDPMRGFPELFIACNRGKEWIALDLTRPETQPVVERLLRWAAVAHHNLRESAATRLGIGRDRVHTVNPNLVYCIMPAFGRSGARAAQPGFDQSFQALSGAEVALGGAEEPMPHPSAFCDSAAAWLSAIAVEYGLLTRARTGGGIAIDCPAVASGLMAISGILGDADGADLTIDPAQTGFGTAYRMYRCADNRWIAVVIRNAAEWNAVGRALATDLGAYAPFGSDCAAGAALEQAVGRLTPEAAVKLLRGAGALCAIAIGDSDTPANVYSTKNFVREYPALLPDEEIDRHVDPAGDVTLLTFPARLGTPGPPPTRGGLPIGDNTRAILAELGFDDGTIAALIGSGAAVG
jgi:crotonobetainyl-CoA:carnitine CoA-transferase CaiB-like acyl-CoA transferase